MHPGREKQKTSRDNPESFFGVVYYYYASREMAHGLSIPFLKKRLELVNDMVTAAPSVYVLDDRGQQKAWLFGIKHHEKSVLLAAFPFLRLQLGRSGFGSKFGRKRAQ